MGSTVVSTLAWAWALASTPACLPPAQAGDSPQGGSLAGDTDGPAGLLLPHGAWPQLWDAQIESQIDLAPPDPRSMNQ